MRKRNPPPHNQSPLTLQRVDINWFDKEMNAKKRRAKRGPEKNKECAKLTDCALQPTRAQPRGAKQFESYRKCYSTTNQIHKCTYKHYRFVRIIYTNKYNPVTGFDMLNILVLLCKQTVK